MSHEQKALEGCAQDEYEAWVELHIRREQQWGSVARHLMQTDPTELVAVMFDGVDKLQHLCWRFIDPSVADTLTEPWEQRVRERCLDYFQTVDNLMAELVELAGPEAMVVLASDHGFQPQVRTFFVNSWLAQNGYLRWAEGAGPQASDEATLGIGQLARHVFQMDWDHTQAYAPMPSGNGIHIVRKDSATPNGVQSDDYSAFVTRLTHELQAVRDPESGAHVVANVWPRDAIFAGAFAELAPDLTLELEDGGLVSILASEETVTPRPQPTGTHAPLGIFMARGSMVRQGADLPELSILDVPSLLLYSLNVPIPEDFEGRVPTEALDADALAANPIKTTTPSLPPFTPSANGNAPVYDTEAEMEIMERLRALGYVE
jgi:predicted AlkP superfamily phosphohydrolase/phosphomutase